MLRGISSNPFPSKMYSPRHLYVPSCWWISFWCKMMQNPAKWPLPSSIVGDPLCKLKIRPKVNTFYIEINQEKTYVRFQVLFFFSTRPNLENFYTPEDLTRWRKSHVRKYVDKLYPLVSFPQQHHNLGILESFNWNNRSAFERPC